MATVRDSIPHELRTASEPRENVLEPVVLANVREVNDSIRLFRLHAADPNHTIKVTASISFRAEIVLIVKKYSSQLANG